MKTPKTLKDLEDLTSEEEIINLDDSDENEEEKLEG